LLAAAARLIVEDGHDAGAALVRAARETGVALQKSPPDPAQLEAAVAEYRALFRPAQASEVNRHRKLASEAMQALADFRPRLFGALVTGVGALDRIRLLLQADTPEQVILALNQQHIPWQESECELHDATGHRRRWPAVRFRAGDCGVELVIQDESQRSDPPFDPLTGQRLQTLDRAALVHLLAADERDQT
jgi:hypothetical protein